MFTNACYCFSVLGKFWCNIVCFMMLQCNLLHASLCLSAFSCVQEQQVFHNVSQSMGYSDEGVCSCVSLFVCVSLCCAMFQPPTFHAWNLQWLVALHWLQWSGGATRCLKAFGGCCTSLTSLEGKPLNTSLFAEASDLRVCFHLSTHPKFPTLTEGLRQFPNLQECIQSWIVKCEVRLSTTSLLRFLALVVNCPAYEEKCYNLGIYHWPF